MIITNIEEITKQKVKIDIDGEFAFVLYKGELRIFGIKEGRDINDTTFEEIIQKLLPKRAKLRAMNLLKSRAYTESQLRDKLRSGLYQEQIIQEAVSYVKSYGYIDDIRFAEDYINYHMEKRSRKKIIFDLRKKGIDKDIINKIFAEKEENGEQTDEIKLAAELLRKKNFDATMATSKEIQKMSAFLFRKGFEAETIRRALLLDITTI